VVNLNKYFLYIGNGGFDIMNSRRKNTISCEHNTVKVNPGALRGNLTKIIKDFKGEKLYITKHNKLVAEILVYSEVQKKEAELILAKIMIFGSDFAGNADDYND
jgi:hypothetical protein